MARMPGVVWKPLAANWASQPRIKAWDIFCLHTMVGSLVGTDGYFKVGNGAGYGGTESHFGVGHDGTIFQWQDTAYQADANGNGNWHIISSENADTGTGFPAWSGSNVPAFTPAQVEANARIAAWVHQTHGIPLDIIPDAKLGRRGIGWHRLGVPGYMAVGAEQWSSSPGKVCPGDRRVAQIPQIRDRARQIAGGAPAQEVPDLDANQAKQLADIHSMLTGRFAPGNRNVADVAIETMNRAFNIEAAVAGLARSSGASAQQIAELLRPTLSEAVKAGMAADNDAQADEIVDRLAARLAGTN